MTKANSFISPHLSVRKCLLNIRSVHRCQDEGWGNFIFVWEVYLQEWSRAQAVVVRPILGDHWLPQFPEQVFTIYLRTKPWAWIFKHFKVAAEKIALGKVDFASEILKQPTILLTAARSSRPSIERQLECLRIPKRRVWIERYLFMQKLSFQPLWNV